MPKMLRDYVCKSCGQRKELFDDEEHVICSHCGQPSLQKILSPLNISTGKKHEPDKTQMLNQAGVRFRVKEGEIIGNVPIVAGETISITPGEKQIIALSPDPDQGKIRLLAKKMEETPEKNKLH